MFLPMFNLTLPDNEEEEKEPDKGREMCEDNGCQIHIYGFSHYLPQYHSERHLEQRFVASFPHNEHFGGPSTKFSKTSKL